MPSIGTDEECLRLCEFRRLFERVRDEPGIGVPGMGESTGRMREEVRGAFAIVGSRPELVRIACRIS